MNYIEQNRRPNFKDELLQLNPFLLYFESLYFLNMLEEEGVCVCEWMSTCGSQHLLFDFISPTLFVKHLTEPGAH